MSLPDDTTEYCSTFEHRDAAHMSTTDNQSSCRCTGCNALDPAVCVLMRIAASLQCDACGFHLPRAGWHMCPKDLTHAHITAMMNAHTEAMSIKQVFALTGVLHIYRTPKVMPTVCLVTAAVSHMWGQPWRVGPVIECILSGKRNQFIPDGATPIKFGCKHSDRLCKNVCEFADAMLAMCHIARDIENLAAADVDVAVSDLDSIARDAPPSAQQSAFRITLARRTTELAAARTARAIVEGMWIRTLGSTVVSRVLLEFGTAHPAAVNVILGHATYPAVTTTAVAFKLPFKCLRGNVAPSKTSFPSTLPIEYAPFNEIPNGSLGIVAAALARLAALTGRDKVTAAEAASIALRWVHTEFFPFGNTLASLRGFPSDMHGRDNPDINLHFSYRKRMPKAIYTLGQAARGKYGQAGPGAVIVLATLILQSNPQSLQPTASSADDDHDLIKLFAAKHLPETLNAILFMLSQGHTCTRKNDTVRCIVYRMLCGPDLAMTRALLGCPAVMQMVDQHLRNGCPCSSRRRNGSTSYNLAIAMATARAPFDTMGNVKVMIRMHAQLHPGVPYLGPNHAFDGRRSMTDGIVFRELFPFLAAQPGRQCVGNPALLGLLDQYCSRMYVVVVSSYYSAVIRDAVNSVGWLIRDSWNASVTGVDGVTAALHRHHIDLHNNFLADDRVFASDPPGFIPTVVNFICSDKFDRAKYVHVRPDQFVTKLRRSFQDCTAHRSAPAGTDGDVLLTKFCAFEQVADTAGAAAVRFKQFVDQSDIILDITHKDFLCQGCRNAAKYPDHNPFANVMESPRVYFCRNCTVNKSAAYVHSRLVSASRGWHELFHVVPAPSCPGDIYNFITLTGSYRSRRFRWQCCGSTTRDLIRTLISIRVRYSNSSRLPGQDAPVHPIHPRQHPRTTAAIGQVLGIDELVVFIMQHVFTHTRRMATILS